MKATGIIRRVDDLGRIVIPKEIRRTLGIKEGDPMELCIDDGVVCFKKYLPELSYVQNVQTIKNDILNNFDMKPPMQKAAADKLDELLAILNQNS